MFCWNSRYFQSYFKIRKILNPVNRTNPSHRNEPKDTKREISISRSVKWCDPRATLIMNQSTRKLERSIWCLRFYSLHYDCPLGLGDIFYDFVKTDDLKVETDDYLSKQTDSGPKALAQSGGSPGRSGQS